MLRSRQSKTGEIFIPTIIPESEVEAAALEILSELGYDYLYGPDIAPDSEDAEREDFRSVVLPFCLREAVDRLNPGIPLEAREEAIKKCSGLKARIWFTIIGLFTKCW